jgi:hypothetical protein
VSIVFDLQIVFEVDIKNERRLDNEGKIIKNKSGQGHRKKSRGDRSRIFLLFKQF